LSRSEEVGAYLFSGEGGGEKDPAKVRVGAVGTSGEMNVHDDDGGVRGGVYGDRYALNDEVV
jgi:hypothetical protein